MVEIDLNQEGEVSINYFRGLLDMAINDITKVNFSIETKDNIRLLAALYASFKREIAFAEFQPLEKPNGIGKRAYDTNRWDRALLDCKSGNWANMKQELLSDAKDYLQNPITPEDIQIGEALKEFAQQV